MPHNYTPSYSSDRSRLEALSPGSIAHSFDEARRIIASLDISKSGPVRIRVKLQTDTDWMNLMHAAHAVTQEEQTVEIDLKKVLDHLYDLAFCIPILSSSPSRSFDGNTTTTVKSSSSSFLHDKRTHNRTLTSTF